MIDKHPPIGRIITKKITAGRRASAEIAALKRIWEGSPKYGQGAVLEAFDLCTDSGIPLPPWLVRAVRAELMHSISGQTLKHYRRWRKVRSMRDERPHTLDTAKMRPGRSYSGQEVPHREIDYNATFEWVAQLLESTSAAGSPRTIRSSYQDVENDLPTSQRYPRTHTKRTR